jgi:pimeloyl-ACP methyl ester carboxylesterase
MPYADSGGVRIHYEVEGHGPTLVMHHGRYGRRRQRLHAAHQRCNCDRGSGSLPSSPDTVFIRGMSV